MTVAPDGGQGELFWADPKDGTAVWEFGVLVSSVDLEIRSLAQLYRDRGDSEDPFDELKNHWGWAGFTDRLASNNYYSYCGFTTQYMLFPGE